MQRSEVKVSQLFGLFSVAKSVCTKPVTRDGQVSCGQMTALSSQNPQKEQFCMLRLSELSISCFIAPGCFICYQLTLILVNQLRVYNKGEKTFVELTSDTGVRSTRLPYDG